MLYEHIKTGMKVSDKWYPEKSGIVVKKYKNKSVKVHWNYPDNEDWTYDKDHLVFLVSGE